MVTRMTWIPAEGTYQVAETNEPFNPTIGKLTFHPMSALDVVAATNDDEDEDHPISMRPGEAPPSRPELISEEVSDPKKHATASRAVTSLLNCAALCNIASVFQERESPNSEDAEDTPTEEKQEPGMLTGRYAATGDPTEIAIQVLAHRFDWGKPTLVSGEKKWSEVYEYPFDSTVKRMAVIFQAPEGKERHVFMKGAVEMVLEACSAVMVPSTGGGEVAELNQEWKDRILANMEAIASKGLRCLALATKIWDERDVRDDDYEEASPDGSDAVDDQPPRKAVERGLVFLGLTGIYDPPRPESAPSVAQFSKASIRTHMLTGDHPGTATAIVCSSFFFFPRIPTHYFPSSV